MTEQENYELKYYLAQGERLLLQFDFEKVRKIMLNLDWKWTFDSRDDSHVPTVEELQDKARDMVVSCIKMMSESDRKTSYMSSGGLTVRCSRSEGEKYIHLYFEPVYHCLPL